jgi:tetratricopeptide (TPR) repeat protein
MEPDGGPDDADILLVRGEVAFFHADFTALQEALDGASRLVDAGERNWRVLDLVTMQSLMAHMNGEWSERMKIELHRTKENPELANTMFDGYLCATEAMLYGSTPFDEVIAIGQDLKATAQRSGALRAEAFAAVLIGESALLSGRLELARQELTESAELHRQLAAAAGEAMALQLLAELALLEGDRREANELLERALPLARSSIIARHLVQRVFGSMVRAAGDPRAARGVIDRAESTFGWDDACGFCGIFFSAPAAVACVAAGDLDGADRHLGIATTACEFWQLTSFDAVIAEARASRQAAVGDLVGARGLLTTAVQGFSEGQQPLAAARCREAMVALG